MSEEEKAVMGEAGSRSSIGALIEETLRTMGSNLHEAQRPLIVDRTGGIFSGVPRASKRAATAPRAS